MSFVRTILVCSLAAAATGCSRNRLESEPDLSGLAMPDAVVLQVENHNWADVVIYVVHDGRRSRLSNVTATKTSAVTIPAKMIGQIGNIQLVAREIGGYERFITHAISVRSGTTIVLTLESDLRRSSVAIW